MNIPHGLTLSPHATIRDAMRSLNQSSLRICMLVNEYNQLLGTVTDGDIRRALLRNANIDDAVSLVMNSSPTTAEHSSSRAQRLQLMTRHDLTAVPIIDAEGRVLGLETLHQAMAPQKHDNPVFIMAGGFGTRLRPLTDHCPKPMLCVGEKPMLEHLINQFIELGFRDFYISTHYLPETIRQHFGRGERWNISIQYVHEDQPLGTGGALSLLPKTLPDMPLIMMNGDVLTNLKYTKLLQHHILNNFDATVCVREDEYRVPFGVIETDGELIVAFVEKPTYRHKINTGIYILNHEIVRAAQYKQRIDLPTLLEQHRHQGKRIGTYTSYDYWLDIGQMKDYQKAQQDIDIYFQ